MTTTRTAIYRATFSRPADLDEATVNTLRQTEEAEDLLELIEVTDVCATFGVSAVLFDSDGRRCGAVDKMGNHALS